MEKFGMAMGPLAVGDLAGLDIGYMARQSLSDEEKGDPRAYCIPDTLVEMGRLGQKSGSGFYRYDAATRARLNDPVVMEVVERQAAAQGVQRHDIADVEIVERLVFSLINEGARILEEGIAQRASDIDVVYVFGYGFPVARGGPMHYADSVGLKKIHDRICDFRNQYGEEQWSPAPLLKKLAREDRTFADWGS
jgi:3-hydroxyacyl-CoA dehydrogenase